MPNNSQSSVKNEVSLHPAELEIINLFVNAAQVLGLPKSVGEIYGLLYCSGDPLTFDDIMSRLRISKGSTSQGLRFLRSMHAVTTVYVAGERRDHYVAERRLRHLAAGILRERVMPHLESGEDRMKTIAAALEDCPPEKKELLQDRLDSLGIWNNKARRFLPLLLRIIDT